ncbi:DUF3139 domain-containing protein [Macrococcus caseolyticus]|uniref:DUF3139 domain-containing protein n=1 Tax=Macrococcoides caseolyticum TaxID=69966 RepID=UPI0024BC76B6|nr:DUF3139 domain-containing protein [Macrococcus caseolyticus]MDJ1156617.1 DUF3139 domain-containing protein [Macrococcus caseolyticus]
MSKNVIFIILSVVTTILIIFSSFIYYQKTTLNNAVNNYLEERNAKNEIKNRSTKYDFKTNEFYQIITFKNEPKIYYEIKKDDSKDKVLSVSYGDNGEVNGKYSNTHVK